MQSLNQTLMAKHVTDRYLSYLQSTFQFRDPEFRASFEQALKAGNLARGPFLEITPGFAEGAAVPEMLDGLLGGQSDPGLAEALGGVRRLYAHQDRAIRLADSGANVVVATGTGSGKTEAFLIPILAHLYREHRAGTLGPGVRALLLYPLNALANDQLRRLNDISEMLEQSGSSFRFTFGRYVGETPERSTPCAANQRPGEVTSREEMRESPPHILMTNYSMLEYLLLRPRDSSLFDAGRGATWTFLVLDEAHQYRGSRGAEMALLVRRLKQRLVEGGCQRAPRCIATSATLAQGRDDAPDIAKFAADLFGEPFGADDVVLAESAAQQGTVSGQLSVGDYDALRDAVGAAGKSRLDDIVAIGRRLGAAAAPERDAQTALGRVLVRDQRARRLMDADDGPVDLNELGIELFGECEPNSRSEHLATLVNLLAQARDPDTGAPLASARYHLLLRALDGVYLSYTPEKRVMLERTSGEDRDEAFEAGLCRECGQHYLLGPHTVLREGCLSEPERDRGSERFGVRYLRPLDPGDPEPDLTDSGMELRSLCVECRCLGKDTPGCDHNQTLKVVVEPPPKADERRDRISRCGRCEYSGSDPVSEVVRGANAPNVVVATALFEGLPRKRRKILAFRDGRQEAAFFAWYAEQTHKQFVRRALLLEVVRRLAPQAGGHLSLGDIAPHLRAKLRDAGELEASVGELAALREAWLDLYKDLLTDQRRISLEGVGLTRWDLVWPPWHERALRLLRERLTLDEREARDLAFLLLDTLRARGAVELRIPDGIAMQWTDLELRNPQASARVGNPRTDRTVMSWDGPRTSRAVLLGRILKARGVSPNRARDDAVELLRAFWEALTDDDRHAHQSDEQLLLSVGDARRLNPNWWRIGVQDESMPLYECATCGGLHARNAAGVCPRYQCPGNLRSVGTVEASKDHYRMLYERSLRRTIRAEEHTAQLATKRAQQVQQDFEKGGINLLSCSTTFELGVDLGDLDVVFLRNVPPEPFNYVQRVGRAGRRAGRPGFAVTFCRRTPHDLYHFNEPDWMLRGLTRPPSLSLLNEKIVRRHMAAVAIAAFLRDQPDRFDTVAGLLGDVAAPILAADMTAFLRANNARLAQHLVRIVPNELREELGLNDGSWIEHVAGTDSRLAEAAAETRGDCTDLQQLEADASRTRDYKTADWASRRLNTITQENVLGYLSRKGVIPKYGFPVDVVELDLQRHDQGREAASVTLQRDLSLAISEYAPTAEVVAAKRMWRSYGLKRVPDRAWPRRTYRHCSRHHAFVQWEAGQAERELSCGCAASVSEYVEPRFGFITSRNQRVTEPRGSPQRLFATRPVFAGLDRDPPDPKSAPGVLNVTPAHPGTMVTLCEGRLGRGFYLCEACGAGFQKRHRTHKTPFGRECGGRLGRPVALGHEFLTDVTQVDFLLRPAIGVAPLWFAFSLAYALAQGAAQTLDIPATDLSSTVRRRPGADDYTIVLYDNVPGGAGLVARLSALPVLKQALAAAQARVSGVCGCSANTSCYGCLRSFSNQFAHPRLQRGPVADYLAAVIEQL